MNSNLVATQKNEIDIDFSDFSQQYVEGNLT